VHAWRRGGDDAEERESNKKETAINNKEKTGDAGEDGS
jgi:hypothetical protein